MRKLSSSIFLFGMPLGIFGSSINAEHLQQLLGLEHDLASGLRWYAWLSLLLIVSLYIYGWARNRIEQLNEWQDPAKRSFIAAINLTLLLAWLSLHDAQWIVADSSFAIASLALLLTIQLWLNVYLINGWLFNPELNIQQLQPTWFVLLSGNFIASIALSEKMLQVSSGFVELAYLFFAIGCFWWLIIVTFLVYRLLFVTQLPISARPSLFIFLAPMSLAAIASLYLNPNYLTELELGEVNIGIVTWIGLGFASMFLLLWTLQLKKFIVCGLGVSSWAYLYPLAAYGLLIQYLAGILHSPVLIVFSIVVFIFLLALIALLSVWLLKLAIGILREIQTKN